jgi:hypothetical protein
MIASWIGSSLHGDDLRLVAFHGQDQAAVDRLSIHHDRAGAALSGRAAVLGTGKDQHLAQHIHQGHIGGDINLFQFTIYG